MVWLNSWRFGYTEEWNPFHKILLCRVWIIYNRTIPLKVVTVEPFRQLLWVIRITLFLGRTKRMQMDVKTTPVEDVYQMLVGLVTPRPIAWVTTLSKAGVVNLAPFSFFNTFGANPPIVVFSPSLKRDGGKKDTLVNIESNGEFVVNASTEKHADLINLSSRMLPIDESELTLTGQSTIASTSIKPPRLADVPFALECRVLQIIPVGNGPISSNLVIGEVLTMYIDDCVLGEDRQPDPRKLKSIARLGGDYWCRTQDLFQLERPN